MKINIVLSGLIGLGLLTAGQAAGAASPVVEWKDLSKDGFAESQIFYGADRKIEKIQVYSTKDRKIEGVVTYQGGNRNRAVFDTHGTGQPDTWISYTPSGQVYKVAEDLNQDGRPDYWRCFQNGVVYRWEQDQNGDGKPDTVTIYKIVPGTHRLVLVRQMFDDDFDGLFERVSGTTKLSPSMEITHPIPHWLMQTRESQSVNR